MVEIGMSENWKRERKEAKREGLPSARCEGRRRREKDASGRRLLENPAEKGKIVLDKLARLTGYGPRLSITSVP